MTADDSIYEEAAGNPTPDNPLADGGVNKEVESIHLNRTSKGAYSWEIKIIGIDLKRLAEINSKLEEQYAIH